MDFTRRKEFCESIIRNTKETQKGCLEYQGSLSVKTRGCYGVVWISEVKKSFRAHRIVLITKTKKKGVGLDACHKCDNPRCVNPKHLFWGSRLENVRDCIAKGRKAVAPTVWGENVKVSKLSPKKVLRIREILSSSNIPMRKIGKKFGVTHKIISEINSKKLWKHLKDRHKGPSYR
jgi:hypothetical protein